MNKIGNIIKNRRLELGLTQEELGLKIGVQKSAIAKYENGRVENMKRSIIQKLSEVLDLSPTQIMGFEEEEKLTNFTTVEDAVSFLLEQKIIAAHTGIDINKFSDEQKIQIANRLLDYIRFLGHDSN